MQTHHQPLAIRANHQAFINLVCNYWLTWHYSYCSLLHNHVQFAFLCMLFHWLSTMSWLHIIIDARLWSIVFWGFFQASRTLSRKKMLWKSAHWYNYIYQVVADTCNASILLSSLNKLGKGHYIDWLITGSSGLSTKLLGSLLCYIGSQKKWWHFHSIPPHPDDITPCHPFHFCST